MYVKHCSTDEASLVIGTMTRRAEQLTAKLLLPHRVDIKMLLCEYVFVRTTLDLPDDLFRQVKAKAALEGATLKQTLTRYIESGLRQPARLSGQPARRSPLPVVPRRGKGVIPNLTAELQARLEEEEDLAKFNRSFGR
jgi:hypothetical protein